MVCAQIQIFCLFIESKAIEGERRLTYWCMPAVLDSLFFFSLLPSYFSFLLFYFLSFSMLTSGLWFFPRNSYYCDFESPFPVHSKGSFIQSLLRLIFTVLALNCFCLVWVSLPTISWSSVVQPPPLTCVGCVASPLPAKEDYFVCLLVVAFLPITMCVFSFSIRYGMHLVVPTHPYFFWVACHPSRTFPPKRT